jgi:hypothetical protein
MHFGIHKHDLKLRDIINLFSSSNIAAVKQIIASWKQKMTVAAMLMDGCGASMEQVSSQVS